METKKELFSEKNIKKIALKNLREKEKEINLKLSHNIALLSGKNRDRINKINGKFNFGTINENEKDKLLEENNFVFQSEIETCKKSFEPFFEKAKNEYDNFLSDPDYKILNDNSFSVKFKKGLKIFFRSFKNPTFLYALKRIGLSLITLLLIITFVTILTRFIPDTKFYDLQAYNKIKSQSGLIVAERYKIIQLYQVDRVNIDGKRISIIRSVLKYIYYILPFPKKIPVVWDISYSNVKEYWTGFFYLGKSLQSQKYVADILKERVGISFRISIITLFFTYLIGYPLGIAMSKKPGGIIDKLGNIFIVINYAIPALVFYLIMNSVFGSPSGIFKNFRFGFSYEKERPITLFPPIFTVVFLSIPGVTIWVRRFMVDELNSDYVKFARAKGLSENRIMYTHVLKNAVVPLIRNIPASFIFAIVGSYFIEFIWTIPGTGIILINALNGNVPDVDVILGLTTLYSALGMLSFLLGDILTALYDPRIKLAGKRG